MAAGTAVATGFPAVFILRVLQGSAQAFTVREKGREGGEGGLSSLSSVFFFAHIAFGDVQGARISHISYIFFLTKLHITSLVAKMAHILCHFLLAYARYDQRAYFFTFNSLNAERPRGEKEGREEDLRRFYSLSSERIGHVRGLENHSSLILQSSKAQTGRKKKKSFLTGNKKKMSPP